MAVFSIGWSDVRPVPRLLLARSEYGVNNELHQQNSGRRVEHNLPLTECLLFKEERSDKKNPTGKMFPAFSSRAYISFRENADVPRHEKAGNSGERVSERHQGAGVVRSDVDVIGEEAAVHARDEHGAEGHESDGHLPIASGKVHSNEA